MMSLYIIKYARAIISCYFIMQNQLFQNKIVRFFCENKNILLILQTEKLLILLWGMECVCYIQITETIDIIYGRIRIYR